MERVKNVIADATPTLASVGVSVGGVMLGLGWTAEIESPPTLATFEEALRNVCRPLNSGAPNELLCQYKNLAGLADLFKRAGPAAMISGAVIIFGGVVCIAIIRALRHHCGNMEDDGALEANSCTARLKTFIDTSSSNAMAIALTVGGILLGRGLSSYVDQPSSLSQFRQVMDAICFNYPPGNSSSLLCNVTELNSIANLFYQPGSTSLWIGLALIFSVAVGTAIYACCQCVKVEVADREADRLHHVAI